MGLDRFGEASAAAVIEARCQEAGGAPIVPTLAERGAREQREMEYTARRERFVRGEGVEATGRGFEEFCAALEAGVEVLKGVSPDLGVSLRRQGRLVAIYASRPGLLVRHSRQYSNSLEGSDLTAEAYSGAPPLPGTWSPIQSEVMRSSTFTPDMDRDGGLVWVSSNKKLQLSSAPLAEHMLRWWLDNSRGDGPQVFFV